MFVGIVQSITYQALSGRVNKDDLPTDPQIRGTWCHHHHVITSMYTIQVKSAFGACRLAGLEVISKYYSPPSSQRDKIARQD